MIHAYIQEIGTWVAYVGVGIVLVGVLVTLFHLFHYIFLGFDEMKALRLRHSLMIYLSLGLDFIIAKDLIVALSLENAAYQDLIQLVGVIAIRILLSYFVHLEEKTLSLAKKRLQKK